MLANFQLCAPANLGLKFNSVLTMNNNSLPNCICCHFNFLSFFDQLMLYFFVVDPLKSIFYFKKLCLFIFGYVACTEKKCSFYIMFSLCYTG